MCTTRLCLVLGWIFLINISAKIVPDFFFCAPGNQEQQVCTSYWYYLRASPYPECCKNNLNNGQSTKGRQQINVSNYVRYMGRDLHSSQRGVLFSWMNVLTADRKSSFFWWFFIVQALREKLLFLDHFPPFSKKSGLINDEKETKVLEILYCEWHIVCWVSNHYRNWKSGPSGILKAIIMSPFGVAKHVQDRGWQGLVTLAHS